MPIFRPRNFTFFPFLESSQLIRHRVSYLFLFLISHRLWVLNEAVLTCTHNQCLKNKKRNSTENCHFTDIRIRSILHRRV